MEKRTLLQKLEQQLEKVIEKPFVGEPPFDVAALKERLLAAIAETRTPYVPDRWFVRMPESLRPRDGEVRPWVDAVWRSLIDGVDPGSWQEGVTPQIDVTYDPTLTGTQPMVGYEFSVSSGPLYAEPSRPRREQARSVWDTQVRQRLVPAPGLRRGRDGALVSVLKVVAFVSIALGIGLAIAVVIVDLGRSQLPLLATGESPLPRGEIQVPRLEWPRIEWPNISWPALEVPSPVDATAKDYTARDDLHMRREPSSRAESAGVLPKGSRLRVMPQQIVQGEAIQGENRWVDVTPAGERLTGQHRYIWLGGLAPAQ